MNWFEWFGLSLDSSLETNLESGFDMYWSLMPLMFLVWNIVCIWKIFEKAGEAGWKTLIPLYNYYILCKIVDRNNWFKWIFAVPVLVLIWLVSSIFFWIVGIDGEEMDVIRSAINWLIGFGSLIFTLINFIIVIRVHYRLGKVFGKSTGFCIGLLLLKCVFRGILAFDESEYILSKDNRKEYE